MASANLLLISQPSLPSIPSLTSPHNLHDDQNHNTLGAHNYSAPCQVKQRCEVVTLHGPGRPCNYSYTSSLVLAGKHLFAASSDREIRVWKHRRQDSGGVTVSAGKGAVKALVVMSDRIFSAHQDHKVRVWRIINSGDDGELFITRLATLPRLTDRVIKYLLPNSRVRIRRHKTATWVHHVDTVSALALSADNSLLYSVSWDRTLKIWRTRDFKCMESVANAHEDAINALAVSPDGYVYTGSADKKIKVWRKAMEGKKHSLVATLEKHNSGINALAVGDGGSVLYSGACDRSILVWEKDKGGGAVAVVGALRGHTKSILCLAVDNNILCSGSADKTVRVWRGSSVERCYSCLAVLDGHGGPVKCLTVARDLVDGPKDETLSKYILYSGSLNGDIKVWQISFSY